MTPAQVLRMVIRIPRRLMLAPIHWYQRFISPLFPARCKYYPTCSAYAVTAIARFGVIRGLPLAILRLCRCQPWVVGGIDDVPQRYSPFYRFKWSKAHEEPRLTPLPYGTTETPESLPEPAPDVPSSAQSQPRQSQQQSSESASESEPSPSQTPTRS